MNHFFNDDECHARACALLDEYGASHFVVQRDGSILAVAGAVSFPVVGHRLAWGASDEEMASDAIDKARLPVLPAL